MLEFLILGVVRRQISRTVALDFQIAVQETGDQSPLGDSSEEQKCLGMLEDFQEGYPRDAGPGHPHVLKDKTMGKKTSLAEKRALAGTWVKKQSL